MPKRGGKRKKSRTHADNIPEGATQLDAAADTKDEVPRTIVAKSGKVIPNVAELVQDLRKLMGPHTAASLKEKNYNKMKDYVAVAGQLGITHLMVLSQTKGNNNGTADTPSVPHHNIVLKVGKYPNGPTLHFHVTRYTLSRQVHAAQKHPFESASIYLTPPLVVLNNFGSSSGAASSSGAGSDSLDPSKLQHVQMMRVTLQHLFPSINVATIQLSQCRRVVLCDYNKETGEVDIRHYAIRAQPTGVNRNVKKLVTQSAKVIPNLGGLGDVSEFLLNKSTASSSYGYADSDSEAEDEQSKVVLPERYVGRGVGQQQKCAMKLIEIGPRITIDLFKIERGLCEDDILYHKFENKTPEEAIAAKLRVAAAKKLKEERRAEQERNVERKKKEADAKLEKKKARSEGRKRAREEVKGDGSDSEEDEDEENVSDEGGDSDEEEEEEESDDEEESEEDSD